MALAVAQRMRDVFQHDVGFVSSLEQTRLLVQDQHQFRFFDLGEEAFASEIEYQSQSASRCMNSDPVRRFLDLGRRLRSYYVPTHAACQRWFAEERPDLVVVDFFLQAAVDVATDMNINFVVFGGQDMQAMPTYMPLYLTSHSFREGRSLMARLHEVYVLAQLIPPFLLHMSELNDIRAQHGHVALFGSAPWKDHLLIFASPIGLLEYPQPFPANQRIVSFVIPSASEAAALSAADAELLDWIDEQHRVVYVSFGSKGSPCPHEVESMILGALQNPNTSVLVSTRTVLDVTRFPDERVRIESWVNQRAVLNHTKVGVFISHGGLSSIAETVESATPLLVYPLFGDQPGNAARAYDSGFALKVDRARETISVEVFSERIASLFDDPSYLERIKEVRAVSMLKDGALEAAIAIEEVLRAGNRHLRDPGDQLSMLQRTNLDLRAVLVLLSLLSCYTLWRASKLVVFLVRRLFAYLVTASASDESKTKLQ
eukprot:CAMPEP_0177633158 /NCGR_PEP_ID=MMETSP0447-20121125/2683_1 /TAXON_ID=0 /ORGANISM="Stygamoeba regulata, Strain BSH-02190019" /LENGTH=485 /DNA_ID=CAMNT_0019134789 /DNA_START=195 /DNA_END=1653 /DNA_ORIENTATION=+